MKILLKLSVMLMALVLVAFKGYNERIIFVSTNGNDNNIGTLAAPIKSLSKAQSLIRLWTSTATYSKIVVSIMPGDYTLHETLNFGQKDGGRTNTKIEYSAYKNGIVNISGAVKLPNKWVKDRKDRNLWSLNLPSEYRQYDLHQLFADGKRLNRSRSPELYTKGPINLYKDEISQLGSHGLERFKLAGQLKGKDLLPFSSFSYLNSDLDDLTEEDKANSEIVLFGSWESSLHKIAKIDQVNSEVFLKTPAFFPVGFFSDKNRYFLENSKKYLTIPNSWCYSKGENKIWFLSENNKSPNDISFEVPIVERLMDITGDLKGDQAVENITFSGLHFQYSKDKRGVNLITKWSDYNDSWLDPSTGFTDFQCAVEAGEAIKLCFAKNIEFKNCKFSQLGSYAIKIDSNSRNNKILDCEFSDLGGGGIIIGFNNREPSSNGIPSSACPANNTVSNSKIHDVGLIYNSSVGVVIMNAVKSVICNNEIYNLPYSGVSCGWTWGKGKSYTKDNIICNNNIHNVMQLLADGGGIYTLGTQPGTTIKGNIIHDIARDSNATGGRNNGIFFDEGSARITVEQNKIFNIQNEPIRYNESDKSDIYWRTNQIEGSSYTGDDGEGWLPTKKIKVLLNDGRIVKIITRFYKSVNITYFILLALLVSGFLLYLKRRRKQLKKKRRSSKV